MPDPKLPFRLPDLPLDADSEISENERLALPVRPPTLIVQSVTKVSFRILKLLVRYQTRLEISLLVHPSPLVEKVAACRTGEVQQATNLL